MNKEGEVVPTIGVVTFRAEQVLLVRHGTKAGHIQDTVGIPSGRIELDDNRQPKESPKEASARELREETGYEVDEVNLAEFEGNHFLADIPRSDGSIVKMSWNVFLASQITGEMKEGDDETSPLWYPVNDINDLNLLPNVASVIINAQKFINSQR